MSDGTPTVEKPAEGPQPAPAGKPSALPEAEITRLTDEIVTALKTVYDPEIPADIYEIGLIYRIDIADDRTVKVDMSLTSPNCPSAQELPVMARAACYFSSCAAARSRQCSFPAAPSRRMTATGRCIGLARHPHRTFHFTPTSASWLNAVQGFFAKLTRRRLKRGVFRSVVDLQFAINRFVAETNADPKPFVWTADPKRVLAAVKRVKQTLESVHSHDC